MRRGWRSGPGGARAALRVELWQVPFETWIFRTAFDARIDSDPALLPQKLHRDWVFGSQHPLMLGRLRHFRGIFEDVEQRQGAKSLYLKARLPDSLINRLDTSPEVQAGLGIVRGRENEREWKARLQLQKAIAAQIKQHASYWLGLVHYEMGRYEAAEDMLKNRTLDAAGANPWKAGARYNTARVYEAEGQLEPARQTLLLDESPQQHGNLLRARWLRKRIEAQPAKAAEAKSPN